MMKGGRPMWIWWAVGGLVTLLLAFALAPVLSRTEHASLVYSLTLLAFLLPVAVLRFSGRWRASLSYAAIWAAVGLVVYLAYGLYHAFIGV